jgi:hypothetical protein
VKVLDDIVLEKGKEVSIPLTEAVKKLKPGDVVIKGANALDYRNKLAGVNIRDLSSGTTGIIMPHVVGKKAYLVIPIGLEKLVAGDLVDISLKMREPVESLKPLQSMFLITGEIVTELEAIKILTGATAFQASAGVFHLEIYNNTGCYSHPLSRGLLLELFNVRIQIVLPDFKWQSLKR